MKAHPGQAFVKIQSGTLQKSRTLFIDKKMHTVAFHDRVPWAVFIQGHFVLQSRTTTLGDLYAQTLLRARRLRFKQGP